MPISRGEVSALNCAPRRPLIDCGAIFDCTVSSQCCCVSFPGSHVSEEVHRRRGLPQPPQKVSLRRNMRPFLHQTRLDFISTSPLLLLLLLLLLFLLLLLLFLPFPRCSMPPHGEIRQRRQHDFNLASPRPLTQKHRYP